MSGLVPGGEMTANEILECSYRAQAIIQTCSLALTTMQAKDCETTAGSIALALDAANALLAPVHDMLEAKGRQQ